MTEPKRMNAQYLSALISSSQTTEHPRTHSNQSYQEYQFYNCHQGVQQLYKSLLQLANKGYVNGEAFEKVLQQPQKYLHSVLAHTTVVTDIMKEHPCILLSHKHFRSEGTLLSLMIAKHTGLAVDLVSSNQSLQRSGHLMAGDDHEDHLLAVRDMLKKEGVTVIELEEWCRDGSEFKSKAVVVDIFGLNPTEYAPFLLKNHQKLKNAQPLFFYYSHLQVQQANQILNKIEIDGFPLQLEPQHPLQFSTEKEESKLLEELIEFLKQDHKHTQKQDVVIFYPIDVPLKRYVHKLQEKLGKHKLKDNVRIITKSNQKATLKQNNIFIAKGSEQLKQWNYDYSNLLYVIDYGQQERFTRDYTYANHLYYLGPQTVMEKAQRIAFASGNIAGKYASLEADTVPYHHLKQCRQLETYVLKMIDYELQQHLDSSSADLMNCLQALQSMQIIDQQDGKYLVKDKKMIELCINSVPPLSAKLIDNVTKNSTLSKEASERLSNLLIAAVVVMATEDTLKEDKAVKTHPIWRKGGYLESCLEIIFKCEAIEHQASRSSQGARSFRKKTSQLKSKQSGSEMFGSMFLAQDEIKPVQPQEEIGSLIKECSINEDVLSHIRNEMDDYRNAFGIAPVPIILEKQDIQEVIKTCLLTNTKAAAITSEIKRNGYELGSLKGLFPHKSSLLAQQNERPQFLFVMRLAQIGGKISIMRGNSFHSTTYLEVYGELPKKHSQSSSEVELEFHGIASSTFDRLWKNEASQILKFEEENDCFIEPNHQMAMIVVHCNKEKAEVVRKKFDETLVILKQKLSSSNKTINYIANTNFLLGTGGQLIEIRQSTYINKCLLCNLHLEVTSEDLWDLFEQFFVLKDIQMKEAEPGKFFKSAEITFNSQRDYYKFQQYFNDVLFFDRYMQIKPILGQDAEQILRPTHYILLRWYVWKSHQKALIRFKQESAAQNAQGSLKGNPKVDEMVVEAFREGKDLILDKLKPTTDEIFLDAAFKGYGEIEMIEILKTPLKERAGEQNHLQDLIVTAVRKQMPQANVQLRLTPIQRQKNGLRECRAYVTDANQMTRATNGLNKTIGNMGESRLYAESFYEVPMLLPGKGYLPVYTECLQEVLNAYPAKKTNLVYEPHDTDLRRYIILKSPLKNNVDFINRQYQRKIQGVKIPLSKEGKQVALTEIGLANIMDIEELFQCRLIINPQTKDLNVLAGKDRVESVKAEIISRIEEHFFYRIPLNHKTFKALQKQSDKVEEIKKMFSLSIGELQVDNRAFLMEGGAVKVQKTIDYLMHFIESLSVKDEEQLKNPDVCGICCVSPGRSYRLQSCGHKFCRECIFTYLNNSLGDASMFPFNCPHCLAPIVIDDLDALFEEEHWAKVLTLAANQYVGRHSDKLTFCFNVGCKQINTIESDHVDCDACLSSFCLKCKMAYHPELTCEQAKKGGDALFKKYMQQNGVRTCPNKSCGIPVIRTDGCYRITCTRCGKSMCFKCDPDKMIVYDTYTECYKHLDQVHGGYF